MDILECTMSNWLDAWRGRNRDYLQMTTTVWRFDKLLLLATKQIHCYELILRERKILNDNLSKCIIAVKNISTVRSTQCSTIRNERQKLLDQLIRLKSELSDRSKTLLKTKLELHCVRQKLKQQAAKTDTLAVQVEQNKLINDKLLERNHILNERTVELVELYRTRTLMFTCKLIGMSQELATIRSKSEGYADASAQLKHELKIHQELARKMASSELQTKSSKDSQSIIRKVLDAAWYYMSWLWVCVSSMALGPKVDDGPRRRCRWTHFLI